MHPVVAIVQERLRRIEREPFYATMGELLADAARRIPTAWPSSSSSAASN